MRTKAVSLVLLSIFVWSILFVGIAWADEMVVQPEDPDFDPANPVCTWWTGTMGRWHIISWSDTNGDGVLSPGDWIGIEDEFGVPGGMWLVENYNPTTGEWTWRSQAQVPEFPLGGVIEIALLAVVIYVGWNVARNTKQKGRVPRL